MPNKILALAICTLSLGAAAQGAEAEAPSQAFGVVARGTRVFYEEKKPGADSPDLMIRDGAGIRKIVDAAAQGAKVREFQVSPAGDKVAVALSLGGNKTVSLSVFDAATGTRLTDAIPAIDGDIAGWSADSRTLYFARRQAGSVHLMAWALNAAPATMQTYDAGTVSLAMRGNEMFLLAGKDASHSRLLVLHTGKPLSAATELMATAPHRTLISVHAASDGVYVFVRDGSHARLLRIPPRVSNRLEPARPRQAASACRNCRSLPALRFPPISDIAMPEGAITAVFADPLTAGIFIALDRRTGKQEVFRYDPSAGHFVSKQTIPLM